MLLMELGAEVLQPTYPFRTLSPPSGIIYFYSPYPNPRRHYTLFFLLKRGPTLAGHGSELGSSPPHISQTVPPRSAGTHRAVATRSDCLSVVHWTTSSNPQPSKRGAKVIV